MDNDCRWKQRFSSYQQALAVLQDAVALKNHRELSILESQGLIQAFEFTHELAWNVMKDYLIYQGYTMVTGSRDAIRLAFKIGLINDGEEWMDTIISRNKSSHTYDVATAEGLGKKIVDIYIKLFEEFAVVMHDIKEDK